MIYEISYLGGQLGSYITNLELVKLGSEAHFTFNAFDLFLRLDWVLSCRLHPNHVDY